MVTMEASSTTISWAMTTTARIDQRFGSASVAVRTASAAVPAVTHVALLLTGRSLSTRTVGPLPLGDNARHAGAIPVHLPLDRTGPDRAALHCSTWPR